MPNTITADQSNELARIFRMYVGNEHIDMLATYARQLWRDGDMTEQYATQCVTAAHNVESDILRAREIERTGTVETADEPSSLVGTHFHDGDVYRVVTSRNGREYAKIRTEGGWEYAAGAIRYLSADTKATAEQAAEYGHQTGNCVFCMKGLERESSLYVGYGPVCAAKHGLPHPDNG